MKKVIISFVLFMLSFNVFAADKADTIKVDNMKLTQTITDNTVNSKGKSVVKYYFIYNGEIIPTNKTTIDRFNLCAKHKVKCNLRAIKKNGVIKRIIL